MTLAPAVALLLAFSTLSGSGKLVSQQRPVPAFHALSVSGGVRATVHKGAGPKVELRADDNLIDQVETIVKDGTLIVRPKSGVSFNNATIEVELTIEALDSIDASGGVHVLGDAVLGERCKLSASGGVKIDLTSVTCASLDIEASGGAGIKLSGVSKKLTLNASGGVELETRALNVSEAKVDASGGVSGAVAVADVLQATLSGGVKLKVKGHPKTSHVDSSGAAKATFED